MERLYTKKDLEQLKFYRIIMWSGLITFCICLLIPIVVHRDAIFKNETDQNKDGIIKVENDNSASEQIENSCDSVIQKYLGAILAKDFDSIRSYIYPTDGQLDEESISLQHEIVEAYYNTEIYKIQPVENECIAYVYYDTKFTGIDTLAPNLKRFYMIKDDSGAWKINLSDLTSIQSQQIEQADQNEEVQKMITETNEKFEQALNQDENLRELYDMLKKNK